MLEYLRSLFGGRQQSAPTDARELFAREVKTFLESIPNVKAVKRVADVFALDVVTSTGPRRAFLENAFAESREMSPEQRREKLAFFFESLNADEPEEPWEAARETFVPVLRAATYGMELWTKQPETAFVRRPFLPYIDVIVAMDRPTSMSFVSRAMVERWKVDEDAVFDAANARLPGFSRADIELYDESHGPLWIVTSNDSYESSRILTPGWLASFRGKVEGNPIAIIPERGTLMIGGDGRTDMVERLVEKGRKEFAASNRGLSPAIYTVDAAGIVVPYQRPGNDALGTKVKIAHEHLAIYEHQHQKSVLDELYEQNGSPDKFVATYQVFETVPGVLPSSLCVWTRGFRTYLPRTEKVVLQVLGDTPGVKPKVAIEVPFESILDRLTMVPNLHPARYETTGEFPSDSELRALQASK